MADFVRTPYFRQPIKSIEGGDHMVVFPTRLPIPDYLLTPDVNIPATYYKKSDANYTGYQLFALRSNLDPLLTKYFNSDQTGRYYSTRFDQRMIDYKLMVTVVITDGSNTKKLNNNDRSFLNNAITNIIDTRSNLCLLYSNDSLFTSSGYSDQDIKIMPNNWARKMFKHMVFNNHIRAHYKKSDTYVMGGIYANLSDSIDYTSTYNELNQNISKNINFMYNQGMMSLPVTFDVEQMNKWSIREVHKVEPNRIKNILYRPTWADRRLTDPVGGVVEFLEKHLIGRSNRVLLDIGSDSAIVRHQISKAFRGNINTNDYIFKGNMVEVLANDIASAQKAASLIRVAKSIPVSNIITVEMNDKARMNSYVYLFAEQSNNIIKLKKKYDLQNVELSAYRVDGKYENCLSCQIPIVGNHSYYLKNIENWYDEVLNISYEHVEDEILSGQIDTQVSQYVPPVNELVISTSTLPLSPVRPLPQILAAPVSPISAKIYVKEKPYVPQFVIPQMGVGYQQPISTIMSNMTGVPISFATAA